LEFPDDVLIIILNEKEPEDMNRAILQALKHRLNLLPCLQTQVVSLLGQNVSTNLKRLVMAALGEQTTLSENILQAMVFVLSEGTICYN
jgi:hypothetical protein